MSIPPHGYSQHQPPPVYSPPGQSPGQSEGLIPQQNVVVVQPIQSVPLQPQPIQPIQIQSIPIQSQSQTGYPPQQYQQQQYPQQQYSSQQYPSQYAVQQQPPQSQLQSQQIARVAVVPFRRNLPPVPFELMCPNCQQVKICIIFGH